MYTELDNDLKYLYIWRIIPNTKWRAAQRACRTGGYFSNTRRGELIFNVRIVESRRQNHRNMSMTKRCALKSSTTMIYITLSRLAIYYFKIKFLCQNCLNFGQNHRWNRQIYLQNPHIQYVNKNHHILVAADE